MCVAVTGYSFRAVETSLSRTDSANGGSDVSPVELFGWSEAEFHDRLAGSAIHRIGYERWLRNLAVGLGNAPTSDAVVNALRACTGHSSELVREHVTWALQRHSMMLEG